MNKYDTEDIIYALSTPLVQSAIGVIRVSGKGCIKILSTHFKSKIDLNKAESNTVIYGRLENLDNCLITVFKHGHGYTGEESLEISCHGGLQIIISILNFLSSLSFRQAERGEFTFRAFMNGKMDLTQAEAVNELINSKSLVSSSMALNKLNGELYKIIKNLTDKIADFLTNIEFQLDYTDEDDLLHADFDVNELKFVDNEILKLLDTYSVGRIYSEQLNVVICGVSNAGKSSLFNYLLREERSIVSSHLGTTRDYIESSCVISDIPVKLYDTAGLRETSDVIEKEGVKRSRDLIESADIILYLIDPKNPVIDKRLIEDKRCIFIKTKSDLIKSGLIKSGSIKSDLNVDTRIENEIWQKCISVSVITGDGFSELFKAVKDKVFSNLQKIENVRHGEVFIQNARQKKSLLQAHNGLNAVINGYENGVTMDLLAIDIREVLNNLGEITGEVTSGDILDRIFSKFCVGK